MKNLPLLVVVFLGVALVSCSLDQIGHPTVNTTFQPLQSTAPELINPKKLISDTKLSEDDQRVLLSLFNMTPHYYSGERTARNTLVAVLLLDARGRIIKELANRPGVIFTVRRPSVSRKQNNSTPQPNATPTPKTGSGPYHQLISTVTPITPANSAVVTLPCTGIVVPSGDGPYVYLGGHTGNGDSSEVESGEQFNLSGGPLGNNYKPYIRILGTYYSFSVNNGSQYGWPPFSQGSGAAGHWYCNHDASITLYQGFNYFQANWNYGHGAYYGSCFFNYSQQGSANVTQFAECVGTGYGWYYGWNGWNEAAGAHTKCTDCYLTQTTTVAQNGGDRKGDGAFFGPVSWSATGLGARRTRRPILSA